MSDYVVHLVALPAAQHDSVSEVITNRFGHDSQEIKRALAEGHRVILPPLPRSEAERMAKILESYGAVLEIVPFNEGGINRAAEAPARAERELSVGEILGEAWRATEGTKGVYFAATVLSALLGGGLGLLLSRLLPETNAAFVSVIITLFGAPFLGGYYIMALNRIEEMPVSVYLLFRYTHKTLPLGALLLLYTLINLAVVALHPALGFVVSFFSLMPIALSYYLVLEQDASPLAAFVAAWRGLFTHPWKYLALNGAINLLMLLLGLPSLIMWFLLTQLAMPIPAMLAVPLTLLPLLGFFWLVPLMHLTQAILYRELFGTTPVDSTPLERGALLA